MSFWSFTKTTLALVSIGILLEPALRQLGYLPPSQPVPKALKSRSRTARKAALEALEDSDEIEALPNDESTANGKSAGRGRH